VPHCVQRRKQRPAKLRGVLHAESLIGKVDEAISRPHAFCLFDEQAIRRQLKNVAFSRTGSGRTRGFHLDGEEGAAFAHEVIRLAGELMLV